MLKLWGHETVLYGTQDLNLFDFVHKNKSSPLPSNKTI